MKRSGKHFEQSKKNYLAKIVKNLLEKSFEEQPGRYLKEFHNIPRHPVNGHNLSNLCTWIAMEAQADMGKMANCQAFADCILEAFSQSQGNQKDNTIYPEHWSCCMEDHKDGGKHYHMAIKLSAPKWWKGVKDYVSKNTGLPCIFPINPMNIMPPTNTCARTSHSPTYYTALVTQIYKKLVHQKPNVLSHSFLIAQRKAKCLRLLVL